MKNFLIIPFLMCTFLASAQEAKEEGGELHKAHRLAIVMGQTHIPAGVSESLQNKELFVPSVGFDYQYWIGERFGIGLVNDLEMASYILSENGIESVEREFPFASSAVVLYKPWKELSVLAGPGMEWENNENFFLMKFGLEYEFEMQNAWDITPAFAYDLKDGKFGAWSLGISIGKRL